MPDTSLSRERSAAAGDGSNPQQQATKVDAVQLEEEALGRIQAAVAEQYAAAIAGQEVGGWVGGWAGCWLWCGVVCRQQALTNATVTHTSSWIAAVSAVALLSTHVC